MKRTIYTAFCIAILTICIILMQGCCPKRGKDGATGAVGAPGLPGISGTNGYNSVANLVANAPGCSNGGSTLLIALDTNSNSVLDVADSNIQSTEICNGVDGADGNDGVDGQDGSDGADAPPTAFSPVGLIDPCGDAPGIYDEVFLQLANGMILASFSSNASGLNTRFSVLIPGNYVTTDGSNCHFSVNSSGQVVY